LVFVAFPLYIQH